MPRAEPRSRLSDGGNTPKHSGGILDPGARFNVMVY